MDFDDVTRSGDDPASPDPVDPDGRNELAELRTLVEQQQRQIDALRARLDEAVGTATPGHLGGSPDGTAAVGRAAPSNGDGPETEPSPLDPDPTSPDRRAFFRRAGAAAAGAVAAGTTGAVLGATPAAAGNGDPIAFGQITSGTQATTVWYTGASAPAAALVTVADTPLAPLGGSGVALFGWANRLVAVGVYGLSNLAGGVGVRGNCSQPANGIGLQGAGSAAALHLQALAGSGPPPGRTGAAQAGMIDIDANRDVWACVTAGTPGTWRKLAGPATAGSLHVLDNTTRVYDSRPGNPPLGGIKSPLANNGQRTVDCTIGGAVPLGATAALVNVTVVNTSASGFLALFKGGITWPGNSTINWNAPNTIIANSAVVALDSLAQLTARCSGGASTDFFIDVVGYYR